MKIQPTEANLTSFAVLVRPPIIFRIMSAKRCFVITAETEKKAINQVNRYLKAIGSPDEAFSALPCESIARSTP